MATLRKMLGNLDSISVKSLMDSIESQSEKTISVWSITYARDNILPIFNKISEGNDTLNQVIDAGLQYLDGNLTKKEVREVIKLGQTLAKETKDPVAQACARAISQSVATIHKSTNSLALAFYGSCAIAYYNLGLDKTIEEYDIYADKVINDMDLKLKEISIANEPNKAKINRNC